MLSTIASYKSSLVLSGAIASYAALYLKSYGKIPKLYAKDNGSFANFLNAHVPSIKEKYYPLYYLPNGKLQTLFFNFMPTNQVKFTKETIKSYDGGEYTLAWYGECEDNLVKKVLFHCPGMTSDSQTNQVHNMVTEMTRCCGNNEDYKVVVIINRGLDTPFVTPKAWCGTHTTDIMHAIQQVKSRCPDAKIYGFGLSFGGVMLSHYLIKTGEASLFDAAFVCSSPLNALESSKSLDSWMNNFLFNRYLTSALKQYYVRSKNMFANIVNEKAVLSSTSIKNFDSNFTIKTTNYKTVYEYYKDATLTEEKLMQIKIPTLYFSASDDDIAPVHGHPYSAFERSENIAMTVTSGGGHCAFFTGFSPFTCPHHLRVLKDYLRALDCHQKFEKLENVERDEPTVAVE